MLYSQQMIGRVSEISRVKIKKFISEREKCQILRELEATVL